MQDHEDVLLDGQRESRLSSWRCWLPEFPGLSLFAPLFHAILTAC